MSRTFLVAVLLTFILAPSITAQNKPAASGIQDSDLKFVVYISRHGVRSPTGKSAQYNIFSKSPWPTWDVQPGYLTPHGYQLMEMFGSYDRALLAKEGLLNATGCGDANKVTFYADSDQRTRETGKALSSGLFPGCNVPVSGLSEGTNDPLFHFSPSDADGVDPLVAKAAIAGRIGDNPNGPTEAYRAQIAELDNILATCGDANAATSKRTSLFDIPADLTGGQGDHMADLRGPLFTASTLTENLLLEYTEGMKTSSVGWGCVDGAKIRSLIAIHTAATDFTQRTPAVATLQSKNLLEQVSRALTQAAQHHPVSGALSKPDDRALFLIGHDTNLLNIAGALGLTWIADGRRDDTPPGGALIFELWKHRNSQDYDVRIYFTAQTLEQMRSATSLDLSNSPDRVPVFVRDCSTKDFFCPLPSLLNTIKGTSAHSKLH